MTLPLRSETLASPVHALLGPTNTGKTHRAIERMLDFESGMIGLPLRLLAREVYDRLSARVGEQAVALITGEEKRVPQQPRYFVCTVEAMPREVAVEFLAVDEIQLVANPERGHVFTDRLLHWRGTLETWFLGSETIGGLLRELLDTADPVLRGAGLRVHRLPRLSQLRHVGQCSLRTLPRRSAVVTFSMPHVYKLADVLRVRRGGAAVVLGALSPRVRNAQVALYESGEVDYLVATDAIGMGLNLQIDHVALAAHSKFDGIETRPLEAAEIAQIVGRAGRYLHDGSFGTLAPEPEFSPRSVTQLETHHFSAQRTAYYRNSAIHFDSLAALTEALQRPPPHPGLRSAPDADDIRVLRALSRRPEIQALDGDARCIEAVWDMCRIPNYEKRLPEHQAECILPLLTQRIEHGRLQDAYLDENIRRLERYDGDIDLLLQRLAAVRTWTYVSHQSGWVQDPEQWRERTRALEDRLGDVLHERLVARFVQSRTAEHWILPPPAAATTHHDRRSEHDPADGGQPAPASSVYQTRSGPPAADSGKASSAGASWSARVRAPVAPSGKRLLAAAPAAGSRNSAFAKLAELDIYRSAEREAAQRHNAWIERLVEAPFGALALDPAAAIRFEGERVARLAAGQSLLRPTLKLTLPEWIHPGAQRRIERRLLAHAKDIASHLLSPLHPDDRPHLLQARDGARLRGLLYQLEQGLGTIARSQVASQVRDLTRDEHATLRRWNIELGAQTVFAREMLTQDRLNARAALSVAASQRRPAPTPLSIGELAWPLQRTLPRDAYLSFGFVPLTRWTVRCDALERLLAKLSSLSEKTPDAIAEATRIALGCSHADACAIARELPRRRRRRRRQRNPTRRALPA